MDKLVSIIVPVYNVKKYLTQSIDSLVNQTYKNLEIILVDDGSTDGCGETCDDYAKNDSRIRVIHHTNKGAAVAKNSGLDVFAGEYFTFVDSDDYVETNMIEKLVEALEQYQADIVEFNFYNEYRNQSIETRIIDEISDETQMDYLKRYTCQWTCGLLWNKLYKRELTWDVRFRNERRCVDDEFYTYKLVGNSGKIARIPEAYYHYRIRKSSTVNSDKNKYQKNRDFIEYVEERYQYILDNYPALKEVFLEHLINAYLIQVRKEYLWEEDYIRIQSGLRKIMKENMFEKAFMKNTRNILPVLMRKYKDRIVIREKKQDELELFD